MGDKVRATYWPEDGPPSPETQRRVAHGAWWFRHPLPACVLLLVSLLGLIALGWILWTPA